VRANTRRDDRLSFDRVAVAYDEARPHFSLDLVRAVAQEAQLRPRDEVLEVGAGSGQLTAGLLSLGMQVTALEPGRALRHLLASHSGGHKLIEISDADFEAFTATGAFKAIFAANSFHWVDPTRSYGRAAEMLTGDGHLCLLWNYPVARRDIQDRLNATVFQEHPDFAGTEASLLAVVHESAAEGRAELAGSGRFDAPWWQWRRETLDLPIDRYCKLLLSYANAAVLDADVQQDLVAGVTHELASMSVRSVLMTNHLYACVARRTT
jgi:SAM-dependent methyltransferase